MMKRAAIEHILRAAAAITDHSRFVLVGTGAVIAAARHPVPAAMMMTPEIDLYADGVQDADAISDLIDGTIGQGSLFHMTFRYYGDGVSATTAVMPVGWRTRAIEMPFPENVVAVCPSPDDIGVAKLCAWRDKDQAWLRIAQQVGLIDGGRMARLIRAEGLPASAPPMTEIDRRLATL